MAHYPNLAAIALPADPCPAYEDIVDSSSDDDCGSNVLEGFMYDDHGELVPLQEDGIPVPSIPSPLPATPTASDLPPAMYPRPKTVTSANAANGKQDVVVPKDANGKIGVKITRMGPRFFLSYVEVNSSAAKSGLGFGDQILTIEGFNLSRISGSRLMNLMAHSPCSEFRMTVLRRPYDFDLIGQVNTRLELQYSTKQGKMLGSVKIHRVARNCAIRNLKLLAVCGTVVFNKKESQVLSVLTASIGHQITLRVMPMSLYSYLLRRQDKERVKPVLQLSPRIL